MLKEFMMCLDDEGFPYLKEIKMLDIDPSKITDIDGLYIFKDFYDMDILESERSYVLAMDYYRHPKAIFQLSMGDYKSCNIYSGTTASFLLLVKARSFMVVHNHTDGVWVSSDNDKANMYTMEAMANLINIEFYGSYILSRNGWNEVNIEELNEW